MIDAVGESSLKMTTIMRKNSIPMMLAPKASGELLCTDPAIANNEKMPKTIQYILKKYCPKKCNNTCFQGYKKASTPSSAS
jgi:hypothetical protein